MSKRRRRRRVTDFARRFPENGMKLLLEDAPNVRDLLGLTRRAPVRFIDFAGMQPVATTFVQRDYRNVECDVVLSAPFRGKGKGRSSRRILVYVLIEHQTEPEELMPLRVLEYVTQIYRYQEREWRRRHRSRVGIRLMPVLPVVFYTGTRPWDDLGRMADLVEMSEVFGPLIPTLEPEFVNLSTLSAQCLTAAGFFGRLLHVVQQRYAPVSDFEKVLRAEVAALEAMRPQERTRWLELLSYLVALVYHDRDPAEHGELQETIEASVQSDRERQEVRVMGRSMADVLREEGAKEGERRGEVRALRRTLLELLEEKFGKVPATTQTQIQQTTNVRQLRQWLRRVISADTLDEMQIGSVS